MATHRSELTIDTRGKVEVRDITREVRQAAGKGPLKEGILLLSVRHTTCALALNENERGLVQDMKRLAATILDPLRAAGGFRHDEIDDNAQAHLTSVVLGPSLTLPLAGGAPVLGTWQSVLLVEMDGPRSRTVDLTIVG
jgi:secondary thiamine-phosphate synthase enzyme